MFKRLGIALFTFLLVAAAVLILRTLGLHPGKSGVAAGPRVPLEEAAALDRFAGAVRIPTVSEPLQPPNQTALLALREYLQRSFPIVHRTLTRDVVGDGSLLYTWPGADASLQPLLLMGHMDVVPVEEASLSRWRHSPFSGQIADGYVWGRGATDDKAAVLSLLEASETLLKRGFRPRRTILFAFGNDEENDGHGARSLVAVLKTRNVVPELVMDEGGFVAHELVPGVSRDVALISIAEKGIASVALSVQAAGGHSSRPPAQTAIGTLSAAITRLESHQMPARLSPVTGQFLAAIAPDMNFATRVAVANRDLLGPVLIGTLGATPSGNAMVRTTTAVTLFQAGVKDNVLPSQATAVVNFRILPGDTVESVLAHVRETVADARVNVKLYPTASENPSPISPTDAPGYRLIEATIRDFFPQAIVAPNLLVARTDSVRYYALTPNVYRFFPSIRDEADINAVHGIGERMSTANYLRAVQFMASLMENGAK